MFRKGLWLSLLLSAMCTALFLLHGNVRAQKQKYVSSGPPSLSLSAEPAVIKACANDTHVQLAATAHANDASPLRYKWTINGGHLRGEGAGPAWDLSGAQPGVYQA